MHINNDPSWLEVNVDGEFTRAKYHGKFFIKPYLSLKERVAAEHEANEWALDLPRDSVMRQLMVTLAVLKQHFVKVDASWWQDDGRELKDEAPIMELVKLVGELQRPKEEPKAEAAK